MLWKGTYIDKQSEIKKIERQQNIINSFCVCAQIVFANGLERLVILRNLQNVLSCFTFANKVKEI